MSARNAIVIGGGLGGIAASIRLARRGWRVRLFERAPRLGGKMNLWESKGYRFDTGPSLITMPWVFEELFEAAGARMADYVELLEVDPVAEYIYPDGTRFSVSPSMPHMASLIEALDGRDWQGFLDFMVLGARIFELSRHTFFRTPVGQRPDREGLAALRHMPLRRGWGSYARTVETFFRSPHLRQLFLRYPTYVGSSPWKCPATLAVIPYLEHAFGGWRVKGGLYRIVEALEALAREAGVEIHCGAAVTGIETEGHHVRGVEIAGEEKYDAEVIVMNGDASMANVLMNNKNAAPLPKHARSMSGVVLLLGLRRPLPEFDRHTIFFSSNYPKEFHQIFEESRAPDDPTVYMNIASRDDPTVAPDGGETVFMMINAPANGDENEPHHDESDLERRMFARLESSGVSSFLADVEAKRIITPRTFAKWFDMPGGAIYGQHSHGWKRAFLRPPNRDRRTGGLYYVGGSSHPGGGTPMVLLSAEIVESLISQHES